MAVSAVIGWRTFFLMEKYHAIVHDSIDFAAEGYKEWTEKFTSGSCLSSVTD
jgi:hypothetical protein